MKIALRCEKCRTIFMAEEDNHTELFLQIDFYEKTIMFICRDKNCKHENILDIGNWQKKQTNSQLPRLGIM